MLTLNGVLVSTEQFESIAKLSGKGWFPQWDTLQKLPAEQCVVVVCHTKDKTQSIVFGIEPDGYAHT